MKHYWVFLSLFSLLSLSVDHSQWLQKSRHMVKNIASGSFRLINQLTYLKRMVSFSVVQYIKSQENYCSGSHIPSGSGPFFKAHTSQCVITLNRQPFLEDLPSGGQNQCGLTTQIARSIWRSISQAGSLYTMTDRYENIL